MPVDRMLHPRLLDSKKIGQLSHLEYRVWTVYILVADDFGVLSMEATKIKIARGLSETPAKAIMAALEAMERVGLVHRFEHQAQPLIWSHNWQFHQRITYPRREQTHLPAPPEHELEALKTRETSPTRDLFATFHTQVSEAFREQYGDPVELAKIATRKARIRGGNGGSNSGNVLGTSGERSGNVLGTSSEHSENVLPSRAPARAQGARRGLRLEANGQRLMADDSEGSTRETLTKSPISATDPAQALMNIDLFPIWLAELHSEYPSQGQADSYLVESAFVDVFVREQPRPAAEVWFEMRANLENQKRGHQWRVKRMIPRLDRWLLTGAWKQLHDEHPPTAIVSEKTRNAMTAADAFVKGGSRGPR